MGNAPRSLYESRLTLISIRYAAPPVGKLRWQPPQTPSTNRTVVQAKAFGSTCPQGFPSVGPVPFVPGDEDCLFVNVYAPAAKSKLPVFVYIHGGGYGLGDGTQDMSSFVTANDNKFVAITLQYRVFCLSPYDASSLT